MEPNYEAHQHVVAPIRLHAQRSRLCLINVITDSQLADFGG